MSSLDAAGGFRGVVLVVAPHMDDEVLACGATLAALPDKQAIHVVYATDGARSPVPDLPWGGRPSPGLVSIRTEEARQALGKLGIPAGNATFLGFPDGKLKHCGKELSGRLAGLIRRLQPDHVFAPFRLDRHPDHLAVHRATVRALRTEHSSAILNEYFVYFRWRLLPGGDVRKMIRDDMLVCVPVSGDARPKREALACYRSQTTRYFNWQLRPILTAVNLEEVCSTPECFLQTSSLTRGSRVIARLPVWTRCAHVLEPRLKRVKDRVKFIVQWLTGRTGRSP